MKSVSTAFCYKFVLFCPFRIKRGLTFRHVNVIIWSSQHVEACLRFEPIIYHIFIWHRFQPIVCLTIDLTADAMLLRPNKDSGAGFYRLIQRNSKKEDKWVSGLSLRRTPDRGLKIRTVRPKSGRMATLSTVEIHGTVRERTQTGNPHCDRWPLLSVHALALHVRCTQTERVKQNWNARFLSNTRFLEIWNRF